MSTVMQKTLTQAFRKARSVNQTSNGYVSKVPKNAEPSGDAGTATGSSIIELANQAVGDSVHDHVLICPYGTGANNTTFSMRVIGWRQTFPGDSTSLWIPVTLGDFLCTLSSACPGVASMTIVATEFFADTIALTGTTANAGVNVDVNSPANDTIGHILLDMSGFRKLELSFTTGGSATDANALIALL